MLKHIYAIYDKAAQAMIKDFTDVHDGSVIRSFMDACTNSETDLFKHPEDYVLYKLGSIDTNTGELQTQEDYPLKLMSGMTAGQPAVQEPKLTKEENHETSAVSIQ